jgi:hypothetical protein
MDGHAHDVPMIEVQPRPTPAERAGTLSEVDVDEDLAVYAATLEDWLPLAKPGS